MAPPPALCVALLLVVCVASSLATGPTPPSFPLNVIATTTFQLTTVNTTGTQQWILSFSNTSTHQLIGARIDEVYIDNAEPMNPSIPRFDSAMWTQAGSYLAVMGFSSPTIMCSPNALSYLFPKTADFLKNCPFVAVTKINGVNVNQWACSYENITQDWYTTVLYGGNLMRMDVRVAGASVPVLTVNFLSISSPATLLPTVFSPPITWACASSAEIHTDVAMPPALAALALRLRP